jgi:hypothetical protein
MRGPRKHTVVEEHWDAITGDLVAEINVGTFTCPDEAEKWMERLERRPVPNVSYNITRQKVERRPVRDRTAVAFQRRTA